MEFVFATFDLNRGPLDELKQVIDSEARNINRFLWAGGLVNSSTVSYNTVRLVSHVRSPIF